MLLIETEIGQSSIHGTGLFCREPVPKGTRVWAFHPAFDQVIDDALLPTLPPPMLTFLCTYAYRSIQTGEVIVNLDLSRHMNHADQPCLVSDEDSNYFAAYDLPAGTELTCDYRDFSMAGTNFGSELQVLLNLRGDVLAETEQPAVASAV